jgi:alpha-2-macroglobulin
VRAACLVLAFVTSAARLALEAAAADAAPTRAPARVERFTPLGTVKQVRQASARFSAPMVALGDPRATAPFDVACPEAGRGRWVDPRTWVYDFTRDMPAGVACTFAPRAGLRTLGGAPVAGGPFAFSTGGPAVVSATPGADGEIAEDQVFVLELDGAVDPASVVEHAAFAVQGFPERVPVRLVEGAERDAILGTLDDWQREEPLVVVAARRPFPNAAGVGLVWGPGIRSPGGVAGDQPQTLRWTVRPAFTAELSCERENAARGCTPLLPMRLRFSAPVKWSVAGQAILIGPDDRRWSPKAPDGPDWIDELTFAPPFPPESAFRLELPAGLTDDAGRPLENAASFPLTLRTDTQPPLAKFAARFGVIEAKADPTLPVTVRNLEPEAAGRQLRVGGRVARIPAADALTWLRRVAVSPRTRSLFAGTKPPTPTRPIKLPRSAGDLAAEVIGLPLGEPGLYVVELASTRLGGALLGTPGAPLYVPTAALVTNLSVHLKWGREASLVWVTTLDAAEPVAGARISVTDCTGKTVATATTDADGLARFADLESDEALPSCSLQFPEHFFDWRQIAALRGLSGGLLVMAESGNDLGLVHSSWDQGIEPFRFDLPSESFTGPVVAHTVLDRTLFRAGETVHMKHLLRRQALAGFAAAAPAERPPQLSIRHLGSDEHYEQPLAWRDDGSAESTWVIPRAAKLGRYEVVLVKPAPRGKPDWWVVERTAGSFRVEEFRVPLMRGVVQLPPGPLVAPKKVAADIGVTYLAGGAAAGLPVVLRGELRPSGFPSPDGLDAYTFANGPVRTGVFRDGDEPDAADGKPRPLPRQELTLDPAGTARGRLVLLPRPDTPRQLLVELEFRDPNGEAQTVASTANLWPGAWLPGLRSERWALERGDLEAHAVVVDPAGTPVADAPVRIDVFDRRVFSTRTRVVGGFYAYQHTTEVRRIGALCQGVTDPQGRFTCRGRPDAEGDVVLEAAVTDPQGHTAVANADVWVARGERFWFEAEDGDRIDVLPEKRRYEPGETARFQVRMPFRDATALVTVEREGVGAARVMRLSGTAPVIELPVEAAWAPNTFVSVLAVRGRVGDVQPTALVDLGRPAFRLGMAEIEVGWGTHTLEVSVATDRADYRVREKAAATINVRTPDGAAPPAGSEVAVAVVDEGLLALSPNRSWDVLRAMMGRRGYGVRTATAQLEVVGKRHYGQKAVPTGGGGGRQPTRELFDTLLLWAPRIALDERGEARVEVALNDSLTSFRVEAVATAGLGQFGSGGTAIRTMQDLMLLPGLPPVVREGDRFRAEMTVRNTTARAMTVEARGIVAGVPAPLTPQTLALEPGAAELVGWDVTVPTGVASLGWDVEVGERGGATDHLRVTQQVRPAVPLRTLEATLFQWSPDAAPVPVARPADALPDRGGVLVRVAPTLTAGLAGVRDWMRRYPYTCLEQRVSRAVALGDEDPWLEIVRALPAFQDKDGLLKYFPTLEDGSEVLTAYVVSLADTAGRTLPDDVRRGMLDGLAAFVDGKLRRDSRMADLPLRKLAALDALSRYRKVTRAQLATLDIEPALWPTSALLDWWSVLRRVPDAPDRARRLAEAERLVRARLDLSGTTLRFSTGAQDDLWWLMTSPSVNAARLLLLVLDADAWRTDLPRLARGALALQRAGHWGTTTANAWGTLAVERFAAAFETARVSGTTAAALGGQRETVSWEKDPAGATLDLAWPAAPADLIVEQAGIGRPWVTVQARAAVPLREPLASGYRVTKHVEPLEVAAPGVWHRGDRLRVRLEIDAQSDMGWVVVDDPVPTGASHLGTGLGGDAEAASSVADGTESPEPAFVERSFASWRAYYDYVPKGRVVATYDIRLNQPGTFELPPTRVEALYAPELFGETPNLPFEVR